MTVDARLTPIDIVPSRGWRAVDFRELWRYRELLYIFAWRDLKVRYRQTILGAAWVLGQPLITMAIFTLLFNRVAHLKADANIPYPLFVLSGIILWNLFSNAAAKGGNSLIGASFMISKVYFPRLIIPLSNVVVEMADFGISALLLIALMCWYRVVPGVSILLLPVPLLFCGLMATGLGLWLAALNVEYRDIRVIIPFVLQLAMYVTPVVYPLSALPPRYRRLALLNPMTGIIESFRSALFGTPFSRLALGWSMLAAILVMVSGLYYFRRMERLFADII